MAMIAAADSEPRSEDIAAILEEEIALGLLAPKERLVEEELAERLGAKRHVVRQALLELDAMGLVARLPNRGATVRDYSIEEVEQLYLVRDLVETTAVRLIPLPAPQGLIDRLTAIHESHCAAAERGDLRRVFRENLQFHRTLFAACGNAPLTDIIEELAFKTHAIRSYSIGNPQILAAARLEHAQIIECLQTGRRKQLVDLVKQHLHPAKDAYLQLSRHKTLMGGADR